MGLDWVTQPLKNDEELCKLINAPKMGDTFKTVEELLGFLRKMGYTEKYIEAHSYETLKNKYDCEHCPMSTHNICKNCPEGSFACTFLIGGGCNYRGKTPARILMTEDDKKGYILQNVLEKIRSIITSPPIPYIPLTNTQCEGTWSSGYYLIDSPDTLRLRGYIVPTEFSGRNTQVIYDDWNALTKIVERKDTEVFTTEGSEKR